MSAFVCVFHRDGARLESNLLHHLATALPGAGRDSVLCHGPLGLVIRHAGEAAAGSSRDAESGRIAAVTGRLHRVGAASPEPPYRPGTSPAADGEPADFAALLARHGAGDWSFLSGLEGVFALLLAEPTASPPFAALHLVRDPMGSQPVYYHLDARRLVAASDPAALLRHPAVAADVEESAVARFLGFGFGFGGTAFFRGVRVLPPGHRLQVTGEGHAVEAYWRFRPWPQAAELSLEEAAAELTARLERSVQRSITDGGGERTALSLSGGLDSTALAALAPWGLRAFSWSFEATPEADERPRIEAVSRHLGIDVSWVSGDGLHPLAGDFVERFVNVGSPHLNPFAALKERLYAAAREAGCRRVMVGDGGDALYAAGEYWLRDLLAHRRTGALGSLAATVRRAAGGDRFARLSLRRLPPLDELARLSRPLRTLTPWLTAAGRAALPQAGISPLLPGPRRHRQELSAGARHSEIETEEARLFAHCGVERSNPFWSWPVLELTLQLPAHHLHRDGVHKLLVRRAMGGRLPREVLEGRRGGLLGSFFLRGIEERRPWLREVVFRNPRSDWQRFVRRDRVEPFLERTRAVAFGHTLLWRIVSYELWVRRLLGGP